MSLDFSAVPTLPDGRTAAEHIDAVAAFSQAVRVPMGPRSAGGTMFTASADTAVVNMAPEPISTRPSSSSVRFGASAHTTQPAVKRLSAS